MPFVFATHQFPTVDRENDGEDENEHERQRDNDSTKNEKDYVIKLNYFNECNSKVAKNERMRLRMCKKR